MVNRKAIGWSTVTLAILSIVICCYIYFTTERVGNNYDIIVIPMSVVGIIIGVFGIIGGSYLACSSVLTNKIAKLFGFAMFMIGMISLPVTIFILVLAFSSLTSSSIAGIMVLLVQMAYYILLSINGWMIGHP
jgi:hypothetical protein